MSPTFLLQHSSSPDGRYTFNPTPAPIQPPERSWDLPEPGLQRILSACLLHICRRSVPPNWSAGEWRKEAAQVAALAALEAVLEYDGGGGKPFEYFVAQRMTSRVRTHHRREWAYALRFGSTPPCSRSETLLDNADSRDSDWLAAGSESDCDWQELREALSHLPTTHQAVLVDLYWKGYTETELGAMLHVSQCAVNKRKQAGLQALRESLRPAA